MRNIRRWKHRFDWRKRVMKNLSDQQIIDSWKKNVKPWVAAVREGEIESRLLVTNQAIIDAVLERKPATVLDVGCGEGWLVRELSKAGINALGVDVVPELIEVAEKEDGGRFRVLSFEALSVDNLKEKFDVIVCNFSY
ncbi:MAG: class I SAM-dependent methyltransferase, partial [Gammaproteobacteria bacterium]|nr:class I SAM-dependent methyltransferase [Gammaproteobacteria bacterium]